MSEIDIYSADSEDDTYLDLNAENNKNSKELFQLMIDLSRQSTDIPQQYVKDMIKMHSNCTNEQQNSKKLCSLVVEAVESIPVNNNAFQYTAKVYNKLIHLSKNDLSSLQTENCVPSTSNGSASVSSDEDKEANSNIASKSMKMFNDFIQKCYENPKFPKSNIELIDKLYKSLPHEFIESKPFFSLLKEANQIIWPDSSASLYIHVQHIYDQLLQFETSMKVQDKKLSEENNESKMKKIIKLKKLKKALKDVRKKIKVLDDKEMDINDSDEFNSDSPYILKDRYEKRIIEIYKRICKILEEPDYLEEPKLHFTGTNNKLVNKTIQKYYNLNKTFPDYFEIYTLLKLLQEKKKLGWTEDQLKSISQEAFLNLGKQLKSRRLNDYFSGLSHITSKIDPAEENLELKKTLDESNKKLNADLNAVTEKFNNIQDYAEETDGSSINNTDCENSSDEDCEITTKNMKKNMFKNTNSIPIKRKRQLSNELKKDEPPKKSQKTVYMESFNLTPCVVALEPLNDESINETIVGRAADKEATKENDNTEKVTNISKVASQNSNHLIINDEKVSDKDNEGDCISTAVEPFPDEANSILVLDESIDDETIPEELQENQTQKVGDKQTIINNTSSSDSEGNSPITIVPEVILQEDLENSVIDVNDDSDVEITSYNTPEIVEVTSGSPKIVEVTSGDTPKVKVQDKKSLQNIIKSMNFDKKYNWHKAPQRPTNSISVPSHSNSVPTRSSGNQNSVNCNQNSSHNFVNRWIINHVQNPRPQQQQPQLRPNNAHFVRPPFNNNRLMQSTIQRSHSSRSSHSSHSSHSRQVTQSFSNSVQQNLNNHKLLQQRVMTMTTTTTVRQVVQQTSDQGRRRLGGASNNQSRRNAPSASNTNGKPELIELD